MPYEITWKYDPNGNSQLTVHVDTIDIYVSPLPCDVTLQVLDMSLVSLVHGIVKPDARCTVLLLEDLALPQVVNC